MALTTDEKTRVRYYLGYSVFENDGPAERALNSIDSYEGADVIIRGDLDELVAIDAQFKKLRPISLAVQVGAEQLRAHYTLGVMRSVGRQVVGRIASFLSIPVKRDVFAEGAPGTIDSGDPNGAEPNFPGFGGHGTCGS